MKQWQAWWQGISQRDRALLGGWLFGILAMALVWMWFTLATAHERAQSQLAAERKVLDTMRAQATEVQQLKQLPATGNPVDQIYRSAVSDSLSKFGLPTSLLQQQDSGAQITLQGTVSFDSWVDWLVFAQKDMRIVLQTAKVSRGQKQGMVDIQVSLKLSGGES